MTRFTFLKHHSGLWLYGQCDGSGVDICSVKDATAVILQRDNGQLKWQWLWKEGDEIYFGENRIS